MVASHAPDAENGLVRLTDHIRLKGEFLPQYSI